MSSSVKAPVEFKFGMEIEMVIVGKKEKLENGVKLPEVQYDRYADNAHVTAREELLKELTHKDVKLEAKVMGKFGLKKTYEIWSISDEFALHEKKSGGNAVGGTARNLT